MAVVAGVWALLVGTGLGSTALIGQGLAFVAAAGFAASAGAAVFALASLALAVVGVTPYLFLYLRSSQHPVINEAAPATFDALLSVIRRAQYPPARRWTTPPSRPGSAIRGGRSVSSVSSSSTTPSTSTGSGRGPFESVIGNFPLRTLVTIGFASLGLHGSGVQRRDDRGGWWLLLTLFLVTGLGLVVYMNFRPGFGRWYDVYPSPGDHEVRERDYFFVVSFVVWGLWAGIGLARS